MNTKMRNLTLTAAALAALTVIAPNAAAQVQNRNGGRGNAPRQESGRQAPRQELRGNGGTERHDGNGNRGAYGYGGHGNYRGYGYGYVAPRPVVRYGYGYGYGYHAAPFRIFSGFRFYSAYPGPGYVYVADLGWVVPPFFGAVWVPGHYDIGGYWVDGFWR